jgi:hypothetical protein
VPQRLLLCIAVRYGGLPLTLPLPLPLSLPLTLALALSR